jgi:hypothetical protein
MPAQHQVVDESGNPLPFSCRNARYQTNTSKGYSHGTSTTRGSVFDRALLSHDDEYSLWLEHVVEIGSGEEVYWLMWYKSSGTPTIPLSGVFSRTELAELVKQLTTFVP